MELFFPVFKLERNIKENPTNIRVAHAGDTASLEIGYLIAHTALITKNLIAIFQRIYG